MTSLGSILPQLVWFGSPPGPHRGVQRVFFEFFFPFPGGGSSKMAPFLHPIGMGTRFSWAPYAGMVPLGSNLPQLVWSGPPPGLQWGVLGFFFFFPFFRFYESPLRPQIWRPLDISRRLST